MAIARKAVLAASIFQLVTIAGVARAETPLERGTYLMHSIVACGNCHTPQTPNGPAPGMELAGGTPFNEDFGLALAANITLDPETGIGKWTDAQIIDAIRNGKRPDGSIIGPPMPIFLYRGMSDEDVNAVVAYLHSVKPVSHHVDKSKYTVPLPPAYGPPVTSVAPHARGANAAYGAYLASSLGHCIECHSTPGANGAPDIANKLGAGGMSFHGPWGISYSANITPSAIGSYSDDDIKKAITTGMRPNGSHLMPPMAYGYYKNIAADDLTAIVAYLRALPPK